MKVEKVKAKRKSPQPKPVRFREIKKYEILHRPFDLKFRGRINKWLQRLIDRGVKLHKILDRKNYRIIKAYFFPQGDKNIWIAQQEIVKQIKGVQIYKIRSKIVTSLLKIREIDN